MVKDYDGTKENPVKKMAEDMKEYQGIFQICFLSAVFYILRGAISLLIIFYPAWTVFSCLPNYVFPIFLIGYRYSYQKKRGLVKSFLNIFPFLLIIIAILPLLEAVIGTLRRSFFPNANAMTNSEYFPIIIKFSDIFLFSVVLMMCGNYIKREISFFAVSIGNLCLYLFLEVCFSTGGLPLPVRKNLEDIKWKYASVYLFFVLFLGYLLLGIFMRRQYKKEISVL